MERGIHALTLQNAGGLLFDGVVAHSFNGALAIDGLTQRLMTRPRKASPTGMPARLPLRVTMVPTPTVSAPSNSMMPSCSGSTLSTIPLAPLSKVTISPYTARFMPSTCTMPSAEEMTTPPSAEVSAGL